MYSAKRPGEQFPLLWMMDRGGRLFEYVDGAEIAELFLPCFERFRVPAPSETFTLSLVTSMSTIEIRLG